MKAELTEQNHQMSTRTSTRAREPETEVQCQRVTLSNCSGSDSAAFSTTLRAQRGCTGISDFHLNIRALLVDTIVLPVAQKCTLIHNACALQWYKYSWWCIKCFNNTYYLLSKLYIFRSLQLRTTLLLLMERGKNYIANTVHFVWSRLCRDKASYPPSGACVRTVTTTSSFSVTFILVRQNGWRPQLLIYSDAEGNH